MRPLPTFLAGIGALTAVVLFWQHLADRGNVDVVNQAWVERMPKSPRDEVGWFLPRKSRDTQVGVIQRSSAFRFTGERFAWKRKGRSFTLVFPQSDRRLQFDAKARRCSEGGFDYCLDVTRGGRTQTLYSRKGWTLTQQVAEVPTVPLTPITEGCQSCVDAPPAALNGWLP